jgi:hypothetical protein
VCTENVVRIDLVTEPHNHPGRWSRCYPFFLIWISPLKSTGQLEAENAALRQQLVVLQRKVRGRIQFAIGDRLFFILLYRLFPSILRAMTIVRPVVSCPPAHATRNLAAMRAAIASVDAIEAATPGKKLKDIKWGPSRAETLP